VILPVGIGKDVIDNTDLLKDLLTQGKIRLHDSKVFYQYPLPLPQSFSFEKVEGMLLGLAVGDALGATTEGQKPAKRHNQYGELRGYVPGKLSNNKAVGVATDDTQMSFWTIEQLIDDMGLNPDNLMREKFCKEPITGIGSTVKASVENYKNKHLPWYKAGVDSLGNGALMRIAPIVLPHLHNPHPSLYADAALAAMITHNSFGSNAACVAFAKMLWDLLRMTHAPSPEWWIETFYTTAKDLEGNTEYHFPNPMHADYKGSLCGFTHKVCNQALAKGLTVEDACNSWGSGGNLSETVPSVLYILATHAHDPENAIIRAVNDTVDNDTIAAIVGAAVGALHGLGGIPERWVKSLTGRIRESGTGQVFRLIFHAKQIFWLRC